MIEQGMYSYLTSHGVVGPIVGGERVHAVMLPQEPTYKAITFSQDELDLDKTFDGQSGFGRAVYQIDAWAEDHLGAKTLAKQIRDALKNYSGEMDGVIVHDCFLDAGPIDVYEQEVEAYRTSQSFVFWINED